MPDEENSAKKKEDEQRMLQRQKDLADAKVTLQIDNELYIRKHKVQKGKTYQQH